jgi:hypothetical protein
MTRSATCNRIPLCNARERQLCKSCRVAKTPVTPVTPVTPHPTSAPFRITRAIRAPFCNGIKTTIPSTPVYFCLFDGIGEGKQPDQGIVGSRTCAIKGEAVRMSANLIRWTGGPGSGKTYQLLQDVQHEVETGRTLDDMILMTFSRSQAADLADPTRPIGLPRRGSKGHPPAVRDSGRDHPPGGPCGRSDLTTPPIRSSYQRERVRRRRSRCTGSLCRRTGSRIPRTHTPRRTATR